MPLEEEATATNPGLPLGLRQRLRNSSSVTDDADEMLFHDVQRLQREARRNNEQQTSGGIPNRRALRNPNEVPVSSINSIRGRVRRNANGNHRRLDLNNDSTNLFQNSSNHFACWRVPALYTLGSVALAALAILTSPQQMDSLANKDGFFGFLWTPLVLLAMSTTKISDARDSAGDEKQPTRITDTGSSQSVLKTSFGEEIKDTVKIAPASQPEMSSVFAFLPHWLGERFELLESSVVAHLSVPVEKKNSKTFSDASNWLARLGMPSTKQERGKSAPVSEFMEAIFSPFLEPATSPHDSSPNKSKHSLTSTLTDFGHSTSRSRSDSKFDLQFLLNIGKKNSKGQAEFETPQKLTSSWFLLLDPKLLNPSESTFTGVVDKILTSTPRLLAIANFFLALTFLLHQGIAERFLGTQSPSRNGANVVNAFGNVQRGQQQIMATPDWVGARSSSSSSSNVGRERLGGFLVFKLLLISAVVKTDMFDLLILLSWYTLICFLRSLVSLCAQSTAQTTASVNSSSTAAGTTNTRRRGQNHQPIQPHSGVLQLLLTVLVWDIIAVAVCVALFHKAGIGMVLLLTCDCAVLALDIFCHLLRHRSAVLEWQHVMAIRKLEEEQFQHIQQTQARHDMVQEEYLHRAQTDSNNGVSFERTDRDHDEYSDFLDLSEIDNTEVSSVDSNEFLLRIDRRMELLEQQHLQRSTSIESAIFSILLLSQILTIIHFCHIWSLDSIQLTLIDGVLALQLHSAIATASHKISERRNLQRMDAAMNSRFEDASLLDLRKAAASGDVCCICLGTMSVLEEDTNVSTPSGFLKPGAQRSLSLASLGVGNKKHFASCKVCSHVKKLSCGHLYHTSCLREVVERARSLESARCPLCRTPLVSHQGQSMSSVSQPTLATVGINNGNRTTTHQDDLAGLEGLPASGDNTNPDHHRNQSDNVEIPRIVGTIEPQDALFRFSTEGLFPVWMPVPAFSFEIVRRLPPQPSTRGGAVGMEGNVALARREINVNNADNDVNNNVGLVLARDGHMDQHPQNERHIRETWLRRLFVAAGIVPHSLTPQEEREALEQLTDMFPQYDRADLVYCLRRRGSAQAVVQMILDGIFVGVPRGDNGDEREILARQTTNELDRSNIEGRTNRRENI